MARNKLTSEETDSPAGESSDAAPPPAPEASAATSPAPAPVPVPVPELDATPPPALVFTVAAGCSLHCLKGVIRAGKPVRAMDLAGGQAALDELVASGHVDRAEA